MDDNRMFVPATGLSGVRQHGRIAHAIRRDRGVVPIPAELADFPGSGFPVGERLTGDLPYVGNSKPGQSAGSPYCFGCDNNLFPAPYTPTLTELFTNSEIVTVEAGSGDDKKTFNVHKDLVRMRSEFIDAKCQKIWNPVDDIVRLPDDVTAEAFALVLDWMYLGHNSPAVNQKRSVEEMFAFFRAANFLMMAELPMHIVSRELHYLVVGVREFSIADVVLCDEMELRGTPLYKMVVDFAVEYTIELEHGEDRMDEQMAVAQGNEAVMMDLLRAVGLYKRRAGGMSVLIELGNYYPLEVLGQSDFIEKQAQELKEREQRRDENPGSVIRTGSLYNVNQYEILREAYTRGDSQAEINSLMHRLRNGRRFNL